MPSSDDNYIYVAYQKSRPELAKVGQSRQPEERMKTLSSCQPEEIFLYGAIRSGSVSDHDVHAWLEARGVQRTRGEWFLLSKEQAFSKAHLALDELASGKLKEFEDELSAEPPPKDTKNSRVLDTNSPAATPATGKSFRSEKQQQVLVAARQKRSDKCRERRESKEEIKEEMRLVTKRIKQELKTAVLGRNQTLKLVVVPKSEQLIERNVACRGGNVFKAAEGTHRGWRFLSGSNSRVATQPRNYRCSFDGSSPIPKIFKKINSVPSRVSPESPSRPSAEVTRPNSLSRPDN